jgi:predicted HicB family RNase H-like nuclease
MAENKSSISQATGHEEIGEFWDEHDFTEFDDLVRPDVNFEIQDTVRIEASLLAIIEKLAAARGISSETLVNLWLQEKIHLTTSSSS